MSNHLNTYLFLIFILFCLIYACTKNTSQRDCNPTLYSNAPNKEWFTSIGGSREESHGHYILSCTDGGFLQIGETGMIPNTSKILVVKTNSNGVLEWKKEFSQYGHNLGNAAVETADGYLVCGAINQDSAIIKLNKTDGSIIFEKTIDNGGSDAFEHIVMTENTIIAVGYINAMDSLNTFYTEGEGYITFLNHDGEKINGMNITTHLSHAYRIKVFNNEYIISGLTNEASDYAFIKIDASGNILLSKKYGGTKPDHCFGMDVANDGAIFLTGHTLSNTENWDTYTMKISNKGDLLWESKIGNPRGFDPMYIHDESWGIKATNDGGCIIVAGTGDEYEEYSEQCTNSNANSDTWDVFIVKFNNVGDVEWQKTYSSEEGGDWAGEDIALTTDGSAIIAVDNGQFGFLKTTPFFLP